MLILTRRVGETLMIGDEVSVTVLGVKGNQVRLGVNAPKDIAVHREEIYQRILHERGGEHGDTAAMGYDRISHAMPERSHVASMNHLENRGFGQPSAGFNPAFDPFEDDYYNR